MAGRDLMGILDLNCNIGDIIVLSAGNRRVAGYVKAVSQTKVTLSHEDPRGDISDARIFRTRGDRSYSLYFFDNYKVLEQVSKED